MPQVQGLPLEDAEEGQELGVPQVRLCQGELDAQTHLERELREEIDCANKMVRHLTEKYYSQEGNLLISFDMLEWRFIVPESVGESLYEEICK